MRNVKEETGVTPAALLDQPKLKQTEAFYFNAFNSLSGSRTSSEGGVRPIPVSEIEAYFRTWGIDSIDERETIDKHIRSLDQAFMDYSNEQMEEERKKAGGR